MKDTRRAPILAAGLTAVTMSLHCETPQAGRSQVSFQSSTYSDFRQLLARVAATGTVTLRANLGFPEEAKDRYSAVVIVHTIGGYRDANEGYAAAELRKSGFATLTYDSFAARGTTGSSHVRVPRLFACWRGGRLRRFATAGERAQD